MTAEQLNESRAYNGGVRKEVTQLELKVVKGKIPTDLFGAAYFNSINGSVNSQGLPFPKTLEDGSENPEFGTPFVNGDGMVFSIDLQTPGKVFVTSRLMKTPCFYADEATSNSGPAHEEFSAFRFKNMGLARMSILLGSRNFINTALIPVSFDNDSGESLLATVDNGRPFKIDPNTLELITPIGWNREWTKAMPPVMTTPFTMVASTAHPSFDPLTKELFTVNYTQSLHTETARKHIRSFMHHDSEGLRKGLQQLADQHEKHRDASRSANDLNTLLKKRHHKKGFLKRLWDKIKSFFHKITSKFETEDKVYLMRFDNKGDMSKWEIVDADGKSLVINQCMHQTSLSRNYILLMDSSFKFAFELLFSNPFPEDPKIDEFLRKITSRSMLPYTDMWIIDRNDLDPAGKQVHAKKLEEGIPFECIHFSTEYDDDQDEITLYTLHNNAACFAEWIRSYDVNYFTGEKYPDYLIGDFATGEMSLGCVGKFVVDGTKATIKSENICREVGKKDTKDPEIGPNTWGIGLYTYNSMISPSVPNYKIKKLHFINFGANPDFLTKWIYDLYEEYPNRKIDLSEFLKYTQEGIPSSIISLETEGMTITSFLPLGVEYHPMSIQFVPRKDSEQHDEGYLLVTMKVPVSDSGIRKYKAELWILDSGDVSSGPVCVLDHPEFDFCFTAHSTWLQSNEKITSGYKIDIRKDYNESIEDSIFFEKGHYKKFFDKYVFPHFE